MATLNKFRQLQELLADDPILTGTVTAHNGDGTSTLSMTGGGTLIANGQIVPVSKIAYVQNMQIIGESVALANFNLEV